MVYILGKKISDNLLLSRGLTKIYGIGNSNAEKICKYFGLLKKIRVKNLTQKDWSNILKFVIKKKFKIEKELKKKLKFSISNLINVRNYRGLRHIKGLPVRGQRSHSNSRTQKKLFNYRISRKSFSTNSIISGFFSNSNYLYTVNKRSSVFKNWKFTKKKWYISFINCFKLYLKKNKSFNLSLRSINKNNNLEKKSSNASKLDFLQFLDKKRNKKIRKQTITEKQFIIRNKIKKIFKNKSFLDRSFHLYKSSDVTLFLNIRYNNFFVFLYDPYGNLLSWASGGSLNLKGKQQGSRYAGKVVTDLIILRLKELKIKYLKLVVQGRGPSRKAAIQNIRKSKNFRLTSIVDSTKIPYNGCRKKKIKR